MVSAFVARRGLVSEELENPDGAPGEDQRLAHPGGRGMVGGAPEHRLAAREVAGPHDAKHDLLAVRGHAGEFQLALDDNMKPRGGIALGEEPGAERQVPGQRQGLAFLCPEWRTL